ncbi:MAG: peptide ABC transporter substrate-binding protein [Chloroflexi bacterium]|nr:peptide ABC transporter substrate-binding protein [Chloroflexota bacterium]
MFRGFRWQFTALLLSLFLFLAGALFRLSRQPTLPLPNPPTVTPAEIDPETSEPPLTKPTAAAVDSAQPSDEGGDHHAQAIYREGLVGAIGRLNPLFAHLNSVDRDISSLIFEGLFASNQYGEIVPGLVDEFVISADGLEYVMRLRRDIRWQNGLPFSADDVIYTLSLLSDPAYAEISGAGRFWGTVEAQRLGDHLLRFRLAQPFSSFPQLLTIGILPEHALRGTPLSALINHPFNLSPIGTGPYQLAALRPASRNEVSAVDLARSPVYMERAEAQGKFAVASLRFQLFPTAAAAIAAYTAREVNALANIAPRDSLLALPSSRVYTQADSSVAMLIFNWKEAAFAERRLRQALSLALDLPALIEANLGSAVTYADSPYPPGSSAYMPHPFWTSYDLAQANALLDAADIRSTSDDGALAAEYANVEGFSLIIEDSAPMQNLAEAIAAQWAQLGFQVLVEAVASDDLASRLETGRFQTAIATLPIGGDLDLYRYWHPAQFGGGRNYGAASDSDVTDLLERARREIYGVRRAALYQQFQAAFAESASAIPLYYPLFTFVVDETIDGAQLGYLASPAERFRGLGDWPQHRQTS